MRASDHALGVARDEARRIQRRLRRQLVAGADGIIPTEEHLRHFNDLWLPADLVRCRREVACAGCTSGRCTGEYWRGHGERVAQLMSHFAEALGEDPALYRTAGYFYDLDYLRYPHDLEPDDLLRAHPFPMVGELLRLGASVELTLAVLEHASHLGLGWSGPLSCALVACGDVVTLLSAGVPLPWPDDLPPVWVRCLEQGARGVVQDETVGLKRFTHWVVPALHQLRDQYCLVE